MMGVDFIRRSDAVKTVSELHGQLMTREGVIGALYAVPTIDAELEYLKEFIRGGDFDYQLARDQLRALWTAYCFHEGLDVDTARYDRYLRDLWDAIPAGSDLRDIDWRDFDAFDNFMCAYLV